MRSKELTVVIAMLQRLLAEPGLEPAHQEWLRKGRRELKKVKQSGKLDQARVFRAVYMITSALAEKLSDSDDQLN